MKLLKNEDFENAYQGLYVVKQENYKDNEDL